MSNSDEPASTLATPVQQPLPLAFVNGEAVIEKPEDYVDMIYQKIGKIDGSDLRMEDFEMLEGEDSKLIDRICRLSRVTR